MSENEHYHVYNRGVDKRLLFIDKKDVERFWEGMQLFNTDKSIGSLRDLNSSHRSSHRVTVNTGERKLVDFIAYGINPNHYHFILKPLIKSGIEKFMHKIGMGYARYFNTKYKRTGALFQGKFRAKHIDSNEYLLHLSAYVNLNDRAHKIGRAIPTLSKTSWEEYLGESTEEFCDKNIVIEQFKNREEYKKFAEESLESILKRKLQIKELEDLGIELVNA